MNQKLGKRSRSRTEVMAADTVCIYCLSPISDGRLEHMPPRGMFKHDRASGMEYATCSGCNNGTSAADAVAAFLAKIHPRMSRGTWGYEANMKQRPILEELAPGFLPELLDLRRYKRVLYDVNGVLTDAAQINADGPVTTGYMHVFAAKLGMALYREHMGEPLPAGGGVEAWYYLNRGLGLEEAERILSIMPGHDMLRQGKKTSEGQFEYNYNTDGKTIIAALASFHFNLHIGVIATSVPTTYQLPSGKPRHVFTQPGQLAAMMPKIERSRIIELPGLGGAPHKLRVPSRPK